MSYKLNSYIRDSERFVSKNTPTIFKLNQDKFNEINEEIQNYSIDPSLKEIIIGTYSLFYTALDYHFLVKTTTDDNSYHILIGDYISSYVFEIFYKNKVYDLLNIFISNFKQISIGTINQKINDQLLSEISQYLKKVS
jgi:hypothetical protein